MTESRESSFEHSLRRAWKRTRIISRRKLRQAKSRYRKFDETTGDEWRKKTRDEIEEFSVDARERYEKLKPRIDAGRERVRHEVEVARPIVASWLRSSALFLVIALVVTAIAWLGVWAGNGDEATENLRTTDSVLRCDDCSSTAVTQIIDGDTLRTSLGRIRIYGADTPERGERCFTEATDAMRSLAGDRVRVERGPRLTDRFNRELFYVYAESGGSIDEQLIRSGLAVAWTADGQHRDLLVQLERDARSGRVGCLWN